MRKSYLCALLVSMSSLHLPGEAARPCLEDPGGAVRTESLLFHNVPGCLLQGRGYRNLTGLSPLRCAKQCLRGSRCFSFNYLHRERRCELNGASASRSPSALEGKPGTSYYGPEEVSITSSSALSRMRVEIETVVSNKESVFWPGRTGIDKLSL